MKLILNKLIRHRTAFGCPLVRYMKTSNFKLSEKDVEEIKIPVPWGHIAGKWWGNKSVPPVLAIHGWQDNANTFDNLFPLLDLPSILAIDLPGCGKSSHLPEGVEYDFGETLVTIHRIKKHFNVSKMPLLTHSFGGALGYVYAATFPDDVKWLINIECARCLLTLLNVDCYNKLPRAVDQFLNLEKLKKTVLPSSYKLSKMIEMYIEESCGSILTPEAALILLKREILLAGTPTKPNANVTFSKHKLNLLEEEKAVMKSLPKNKQEDLHKFISSLEKSLETARKNLKNFRLDKADDKFYSFTSDPSLKILMECPIYDEDFIIKVSHYIKCPVLSVRAKNGFLYGSSKKLYEKTLDLLKEHSAYTEYHDVEGTHYVHLNNPEHVAQIINNFVKKV